MRTCCEGTRVEQPLFGLEQVATFQRLLFQVARQDLNGSSIWHPLDPFGMVHFLKGLEWFRACSFEGSWTFTYWMLSLLSELLTCQIAELERSKTEQAAFDEAFLSLCVKLFK